MLDWYTEDYINFVEECKKNLQSIKTNKKNDVINNIIPPSGVRDWSDALIKLAENQLIIAQYMAQQTGSDDGY